jgi:hypothetical protein
LETPANQSSQLRQNKKQSFRVENRQLKMDTHKLKLLPAGSMAETSP